MPLTPALDDGAGRTRVRRRTALAVRSDAPDRQSAAARRRRRARRALRRARSAASRPPRSIPACSPGPGTSRIWNRTDGRPSTAKSAVRTARCCASTTWSPAIARSRSRPASSFPPGRTTARCPGPTIRATEGDRVRVNFLNQGSHPHTIHFHGWHPPEMDGSLPGTPGRCRAGDSSTSSTPTRPACTSITATPCR